MPNIIITCIAAFLIAASASFFGYGMGKADGYEEGIKRAKELIKESRQADEQHTKGE